MVGYKKAIPARAFCLGQDHKAEQELCGKGLLRKTAPGQWEVLTREARVQGEAARDGDFVKLDSIGMPYPVKRDFFLANHVPQEDGTWLQKSRPLRMWCRDEAPCKELQFLLEQNLLEYCPAQPESAFRAFLFGTRQTAAADAVIVFDAVEHDADGQLCRVDFHFVARDEFEKTYHFRPDPAPEAPAEIPGLI